MMVQYAVYRFHGLPLPSMLQQHRLETLEMLGAVGLPLSLEAVIMTEFNPNRIPALGYSPLM
jgi:hypothetical protein